MSGTGNTATRPTKAEIKLIRQIRHDLDLPDSGWTWRPPTQTYTHDDGRAFTWDGGDGYDLPYIGVAERGAFFRSFPVSYRPFQWINVHSVTEAVDTLVVFGMLAQRYSSAYAAGWETGREDIEHPGPAGPAFRAIVPAALR